MESLILLPSNNRSICTDCGAEIDINHSYCPWCGRQNQPPAEPAAVTKQLESAESESEAQGDWSGAGWNLESSREGQVVNQNPTIKPPAPASTSHVPGAAKQAAPRTPTWRAWLRPLSLTLLIVLLAFIAFITLGIYQGINDRQVQRKVAAIEEFNKGRDKMDQGEHDLAMAHFREALRLEPNFEAAAQFLNRAEQNAQVLASQYSQNPTAEAVPPTSGVEPEAAPAEPSAPQATPSALDADKLFNEAQSLSEQEEWQLAAATLEVLRSEVPEYRSEEVTDGLSEALLTLATIELEKNELKEALRYLDQAGAARVQNTEVEELRQLIFAYLNGQQAYNNQQWDSASKELNQVYRLNPNFLKTTELLALSYFQLGQQFEERAIWCQAAEQYKLSFSVKEEPEVSQLAEESENQCSITASAASESTPTILATTAISTRRAISTTTPISTQGAISTTTPTSTQGATPTTTQGATPVSTQEAIPTTTPATTAEAATSTTTPTTSAQVTETPNVYTMTPTTTAPATAQATAQATATANLSTMTPSMTATATPQAIAQATATANLSTMTPSMTATATPQATATVNLSTMTPSITASATAQATALATTTNTPTPTALAPTPTPTIETSVIPSATPVIAVETPGANETPTMLPSEATETAWSNGLTPSAIAYEATQTAVASEYWATETAVASEYWVTQTAISNEQTATAYVIESATAIPSATQTAEPENTVEVFETATTAATATSTPVIEEATPIVVRTSTPVIQEATPIVVRTSTPVIQEATPTVAPTAVPEEATSTPSATPASPSPGFVVVENSESVEPSCGGHYIRGSVTLPSGAAVPGVTIVAIDEYNNQKTAVSKADGLYDIPINSEVNSFEVTIANGPSVNVTHREELAQLPNACHIIDWHFIQ